MAVKHCVGKVRGDNRAGRRSRHREELELSAALSSLSKGKRVRVIQTIAEREGELTGQIEGVVESVESRATGSWFAHGKHDKLWLRRVLLRKDDGEQILVNVDPRTRITVLN